MKFSAHCLLWTDRWSHSSLSLIDHAAELGFSALEITLRDLEAIDEIAIRKRLQAANIQAICGTGLSEGQDITSSDSALRAAGTIMLKQTVRKAAALGSDLVTGVIYAPWRKLVGRGPTYDELCRSAEALGVVARYAQDYGVRLGVEPVNRYETYMLNTAQQALDYIQLVGESNVGIHLDTFHMNIEEKSMSEAIAAAGDQLFHLHVIENDRGIPGSGRINWDDLFSAIVKTKYTGMAGIETFLVATPQVAALTCVWRKLAPDGDTLAKEGLLFLQKMAKQHGW